MAVRNRNTRVSSRLTRIAGNDAAGLRLVCLPYAGASTMVYRGWPARLPAGVDILGADPPGRAPAPAGRQTPGGLSEVAAVMAAEIAALPRLPTVLFGHSLGALLAYEVAVELTLRGVPVEHLVVSGCAAPHRSEKSAPLSHLGQEEFFAAWNASMELAESIRDSQELRDLLYPMMRYDIWLYDTYVWWRRAGLTCPVTAFAGSVDGLTADDAMNSWWDLTSGAFYSRLFAGDHFFLHSSEREVVEEVGDLLDGVRRRALPR
ncbi:thioesterase [Streptomyces camponoticapitis]|uniref:Thioesterase n=1 Tax=Streptomyces camponoticapitis TaxID=1616125 RepID=A0ABQ2EXK6_9ACTN|nr:thioesterase [Streptomyces camponoticapitis]GGK29851.1 thioesterase [Streptomyces camponoticapitis]